jgi:hypothetical protein
MMFDRRRRFSTGGVKIQLRDFASAPPQYALLRSAQNQCDQVQILIRLTSFEKPIIFRLNVSACMEMAVHATMHDVQFTQPADRTTSYKLYIHLSNL